MHSFKSHSKEQSLSESVNQLLQACSCPIQKGAIFTHMWSWGQRKNFIWPFNFLPCDCLKLSLTLVCVCNCASSVRFLLQLCAGNNDRQDATSFLTSWQPLSRQRKVSSTQLRHQPIQSSNCPSLFNLSTLLGHQPIQSFNLVWIPANSIFQIGLNSSFSNTYKVAFTACPCFLAYNLFRN